ncbi:sigma-54 interaction domain-containing protein [Clostridium sp. Cult2]|uniref:sigma-54 interaction domain-containing protein n=1 Tax=Clostridium sp. Cult2 TaxID=2079003 RepID=UPI001EFF6847|nr:sigma 54-interacting transcriptional regulator [Clostridium sp. Cult2]MCF6465738.1 transcriptional regulator [Clostridium sp. Cult2]
MASLMNKDELIDPQYKEMFIKALNASSDGILICDNKGNVLYVNHAYENTTGLKRDDLLGRNLKMLLEQKLFNKAASLSVLENQKPFSLIHQYVTGKSALTTANPIFNEDGELLGVVCNTRNITELVHIRRELEKTKELTQKYSDELQKLREEQLKCEGLIYKSQTMAETLKFASKVSDFDSTVLITGESGTGKEVLAKFIHQHSPRKDGPFIKVNCSAIPAELFESELFGYVPGSFTGASSQGKTGMFELADGGTILLDEIGELDLSVQPKLLRVLQEMEVHPVGAEKPIKIDIRVLAATNVNLGEAVKEGCFREDLFFRLNVLPIKIPPLRERKEDVNEIASHFLEKLNRKYKKNITFTSEVEHILTNYSWPGNVRELENLVEYLFIVNPSDQITVEQLPSWVLTEHVMEEYICENGDCTPRLNYMLDMYEKNIITFALRKHNSVKETAKTLDIHPSTLFRKIKKHNINTDFLD